MVESSTGNTPNQDFETILKDPIAEFWNTLRRIYLDHYKPNNRSCDKPTVILTIIVIR